MPTQLGFYGEGDHVDFLSSSDGGRFLLISSCRMHSHSTQD